MEDLSGLSTKRGTGRGLLRVEEVLSAKVKWLNEFTMLFPILIRDKLFSGL